ncbi:hypothetical protein AGABI1DRAFT_130862 [Agaricus bisporus var. burnettii JB137-S8]|uniref:DUF6534 domain-containing protein n=1 Tax=Agaricus bisporus var. burnettii (strain JB137-S8 / ATCC MYA-4627 / FGSC 10392) TaxID=597362 RepID=K5X1Q1_AGABU|nr:uncharacterized protein AGABI1DRAFT_130862 [Agaricus bisporus var. burnettii JB137-S8]EKM76842.1 hypothetical protein AGABI1DRAFT_130862 [Agaricus bisporus var. burnettii JB137-S8]
MGSIPQRISIGDTYGASYIGVIVTAALYGLTTLQTYFYYVNYPKDGPGLKLLVALIWSLDTLHMADVTYCIYYYLVTNYNNPPALAIGHWSLFLGVALNVTIAFIVQFYFTAKIYALCKRYKVFVTTLIGLTVFAHLAFGMETVALLFIKKEFSRLPEITYIAATPFALLAVLSDIFIAGALCILLWGSKTGFKSTNNLISKLIIYAINRCLLTSVVAIAEVIAFTVSPKTLWYLAIDFAIGKLYANSLLATLNNRQAMRDRSFDTANTVHLSEIDFQRSLSSRAFSDMQRDQVQVSLRSEIRIDKDRPSAAKTDYSGSSGDSEVMRMSKV